MNKKPWAVFLLRLAVLVCHVRAFPVPRNFIAVVKVSVHVQVPPRYVCREGRDLADVSGESGHGITRLLRAEMAVPLVFNGAFALYDGFPDGRLTWARYGSRNGAKRFKAT